MNYLSRIASAITIIMINLSSLCGLASGQPPTAAAPGDAEVRQALERKISLELRDATLLDALFTVRDASGINIIVGNEVVGTVNASFKNTPVYQVLDSLLIARGYGYRMVSGSLSVTSLQEAGSQLPLFQTSIIRLRSAMADDLIQTVESMLSPEGRVHSVPSSNSLVVIDYPDRLALIAQQVQQLEEAATDHRSQMALSTPSMGSPIGQGTAASNPANVVRVFQPQFVTATILVEALRPLINASGQISPIPLEDKILVCDTPQAIERVAAALLQLDLPRPQVRIHALIYDCSLEDIEKIGVNWRSGVNGSSVSSTGLAEQSVQLDTVTARITPNTANGVMTLTSLNRNSSISGIIQALDTADDSRLLADPNVVVMNHEVAKIEIVKEVPFQQLTQGIQGGTIGTTSFREAGVTLNVTPHIAQDGTLSINVNPRFSLLSGFTPDTNAPIIDRRETNTTVRVLDKQTLVLGGLRQRTRITERSGIPGLSRVPYLGRLFRYKRLSTRESELIVFITPEIVGFNYSGSDREMCLAGDAACQVEQTPTMPIPFGTEAVRAEDIAYNKTLDELHWFGKHKTHPRMPVRAGNYYDAAAGEVMVPMVEERTLSGGDLPLSLPPSEIEDCSQYPTEPVIIQSRMP